MSEKYAMPFDGAQAPSLSPSSEVAERELIDPIMVAGMEQLQRAYFGEGLFVDVTLGYFGGRAYLPDDEVLDFHLHEPGEDSGRGSREGGPYDMFLGLGFSDAQIDAGISRIVSRQGGSQMVRGGTTYVSGVLDPGSPTRALYTTDRVNATDVALSDPQREALIRQAFIYQLGGYTARLYPDLYAFQAVNALIDRLVESSDVLETGALRGLLEGRSLPGSEYKHNMAPTVVADAKFSSLLEWCDPETHPGNQRHSQLWGLVNDGRYFGFIAQSLGYGTGGPEEALQSIQG